MCIGYATLAYPEPGLRYISLGSVQAGQVWICPASVTARGVAQVGKHVLRRRSPSLVIMSRDYNNNLLTFDTQQRVPTYNTPPYCRGPPSPSCRHIQTIPSILHFFGSEAFYFYECWRYLLKLD